MHLCSQLPASWAQACQEHGTVFAWAHDGAKAGNDFIEIKNSGVLVTRWGEGMWSAAPGVPDMLDLSFGSSRHSCLLGDGGRFEVVQRFSLKNDKELRHPRVNGVPV